MRLIDADALGVGLCSQDILPADYCTGWNSLIRLLENAPTVDAVPVVRCGKCKNWKPYGSKAARKIGDPLERYGGCEIWHGGHLESGFCSDGKRRDQSEDVRNMGQFAGGGKMDGGSDERP